MSTETNLLLDISALADMKGARVAIIATEWNNDIVASQIEGARRIAEQTGAEISSTIYVPGSFELPFACKALWDNTLETPHQVDAIIAFGAVVRGGTPHFEYVCKSVTEGITQLNLTLPVPVIFGVLTVDNELQAWERLGGAHGHKGEESMITALKMIKVARQLQAMKK